MATKRKSSGQSRKQSLGGSELLMHELQQIHSAENQLSRVLPRFSKVVESDTLRAMMDERLKQGERLLEEVDSALEQLEGSPGRGKNVAAEGLINDAREHVQEIQAGAALDSVLIASLQKTEHYCIAAWGTAKSLAEAMGQKEAVRSMERALKEGKQLDERLTQLAEKEITPALLSGEESEDAESESEDEDMEDEDEEEESSGRSRKSRGRR